MAEEVAPTRGGTRSACDEGASQGITGTAGRGEAQAHPRTVRLPAEQASRGGKAAQSGGAAGSGEVQAHPRTVRLPAGQAGHGATDAGLGGARGGGAESFGERAASAAWRKAVVEELRPGALVGSYELVRPIARGAAGAVFLARDRKLGRRVAIKFLVSSDGAVARRFLVEAQATARCVHENIVVIHEVGSWQGLPFLVLEYLDGPALSSALAEAPLPLSRAIELIVPVVRALGCAHRAEIVHRDLKPDNIIVTRGGVVKVVDFGIAKLFQGEREEGGAELGSLGGGLYETLSGPGSLVGTLPYMAPEQWRGDEVDARCDFFAVGVILFRMLSGQHPAGELAALAPLALREEALSEAPYASIAEVAPGLPAAVVAVVDRCLRKAAAERPASAEELLEELEGVARRLRRAVTRGEVMEGDGGDAGGSGERGAADPYLGLSAFTAEDAGRFFGRSREATAALAILRRASALAVVGPSGSGKSSLVLAGVAPGVGASFGAAGGCEVIALRPGRAPLAALLEASRAVLPRASGASGLTERQLRDEPGALGVALRERCHERGGAVLLVVDQFEEVFTLAAAGERGEAERRAFIDALLAAADDVASPIRLVLTLRADFLHRVAEHPWLTEVVGQGMLLLTPPDRAALREALVGPLAPLGYAFEDEALIEEILRELETSAVPLPLLQLVGRRLWSRRDGQRRRLSRQAYREVGGVHGALAGQADDVLAGLSSSGRKLVRAMALRLVTPQGTRAVVDRAELLAMSGEAAAVLGSLVTARLLVLHEDEGSVELIHEALIEHWPALRGWMQESREGHAVRERLAGAARQWDEAGRPPGLLWTGEALGDVRAALAYEVPLGRREQEFAAASGALATRTARRRRMALTAVVVGLAAVAVAAVVALAAVRSAEGEARAQAAVARGEAARAQAAERSLSEKIEQLERKERERQAAEAAAAQSRRIAEERRGQVERGQVELEGALAEAQAAQREAEAAAGRARELAAQERALRQELGQALARERKRFEELRQQRSKIEQRLE